MLSVWDCLGSLSSDMVEQKLEDVMVQLEKRTGRKFFNVFMDDAQVGAHELVWYFLSRDKKEGRPFLTGWLQTLGSPIFEHFHFNLIGTTDEERFCCAG
jgi:hypothetical protein